MFDKVLAQPPLPLQNAPLKVKSPGSPTKEIRIEPDLFDPPWDIWNDHSMNKFKWHDVMEELTTVRKLNGYRKAKLFNDENGSHKEQSSASKYADEENDLTSFGKTEPIFGETKTNITRRKKDKIIRKGKKFISGRKNKLRCSVGQNNDVSSVKEAPAEKFQRAENIKILESQQLKLRNQILTNPYQKISPSFNDPRGRDFMPPSLKVNYWQRPVDIDPNRKWVLDPETDPFDLWTDNLHLMKSKVMRHIISAVMGLEKAGSTESFEKDQQTMLYTPNSGEHWKPRDHVYSWTAVGENNEHNPLFNPFGIYVVRLFYMGKWRQIFVDDYLPFDENNNLLLPRSRNPSNLWMQLLTKGLLKIASTSWTKRDETLDFNPICHLTRWICNSFDVSILGEYQMWKIIQGHTIQRDTQPQSSNESIPEICVRDALDVFVDKAGSRFVFLHLPDVEEEGSTIAPCYESLALLKSAMNDKIPECIPKWQTMRWVHWARDNGVIRGMPGTTRRIVELFIPLKKNPHIFQEEECSEKLRWPSEAGILLTGQFQCDMYLFSNIYKYFKKIDVYFKNDYFMYSNSIDNTLLHLQYNKQRSYSSVSGGLSSSKISAQSVDTNVIKEYFFITCDSTHCKNIFVTLTALNKHRNTPAPYIMCEGYSWHNTSRHPCWFSIKTCGTKTQSINLGPGIWYNLPCIHYIAIHSRAHFYLSGRDGNIYTQSKGGESLKDYGIEVSRIFYDLMKVEPGSEQHGKLLGSFVAAFCPPNMRYPSLPTPMDPKMILSHLKIEEVFEEKLTELLFERALSDDDVVEIIQKYQLLFFNPAFGEKYLINRFAPNSLLVKLRESKDKFKQDYFNLKINSVKEHSCHLAEDEGKQLLSPRNEIENKNKRKKPTNKTGLINQPNDKTTYETKKGQKPEEKVKDEQWWHTFSKSLLGDAATDVALLQKMLLFEEEVLAKYPFRYDFDTQLVFHDFTGVADIVEQECSPMSLIILNVHSPRPSPCGFILFSENKRTLLELYNLDTGISIPLHYGINATCNLIRNTYGYALLVITPALPGDNAAANTQASFNWRVRVFGTNFNNLPHQCLYTEKIPGDGEICKGLMGYGPILNTQTLTGYYYPNPFCKVCRFLIKIEKTAIVCLTFSSINKDAKLNLTFQGKHGKMLIDVVGTGDIVVPALVLKFNEAEYQQPTEGTKSSNYFWGEVKVMDNTWPVTAKADAALHASQKLRQKRSSRCGSRKNQTPGNAPSEPQWKINLFVESREVPFVHLSGDSRNEHSFYSKKPATWGVDNPKRSNLGKKYREEYLEAAGRDSVSVADSIPVSIVKTASLSINVPGNPLRKKSLDPKQHAKSRKRNFHRRLRGENKENIFIDQERQLLDKYVDHPPGKRLLPPLIDNFAVPFPEYIIPIIIKPEPAETMAPPHLGPFKEKLPQSSNWPKSPPVGKTGTTNSGDLNIEDDLTITFVKSELISECEMSSRSSILISGLLRTSDELHLQKLKRKAANAVVHAYNKRDEIINQINKVGKCSKIKNQRAKTKKTKLN